MILRKGKKATIKKYKIRPNRWNSDGMMDRWMGKTVTIQSVRGNFVKICEDQHILNGWSWTIDNFLPLNEWKGTKK